MADAVTILRQEIAHLERELTKRQTALAMLTGTAPARTSPLAARSVSRPPPPAVSPLRARIVSYLRANKGELFAPAQVTAALAKRDRSLKQTNVQRRLGELFQRKQIKREHGRYGMA